MYDRSIYDEILDKLSAYIRFLNDVGMTVSFSEISEKLDPLFPVLVAYRKKLKSGITIPVTSGETLLLSLSIAITNDVKKLEKPLNTEVYRIACSAASKEDKMQFGASCLIAVINEIYDFLLAIDNKRDKKYDVFVKAIKFMFKNYSNSELSALKVAKAIGYSLSHLEHMFKIFSRSTPGQYLLHVRLQESLELLLNTSYSVATIAKLVGFNNANYYSIAFKDRYGSTPREWRMQNEE